MGPAEIVASLKELCEEEGPRIGTKTIVHWIERHGGYESDFELIAYSKKMKARQYARQLMYEDEETGLRVKRLWSFRDRETGERFYHDIAQLPPERRRKLIQQYARFVEQLRSVRKAMTDFIAGQSFFEFYGGGLDEAPAAPRPAQCLLEAVTVVRRVVSAHHSDDLGKTVGRAHPTKYPHSVPMRLTIGRRYPTERATQSMSRSLQGIDSTASG